MMKGILAAAAAACMVASLPALAQDRACPKADAARAEKSIERIVTWTHLHKAFQEFGHCDEGAASEAFLDAVLRLAVEWKNVDAFVAAAQGDAAFKAFIHKHLRSPGARDDAPSVYSRAKKDCPAKHEAFCEELAGVVKPAN